MIMEKFKLDGKLAVVTGSRRGLGRALALGLAQAGADIVSLDRNEPDETRALITGLGREHNFVQVDLEAATPEKLAKVIEQIHEDLGRLDILVNNAGICPRQELKDYSSQKWSQTIQVNLNAPWYLAQAAARWMAAAGGGKIINIASLLSHQGGVIVPGYTASKHGLVGMTKAMSNELAPLGINVNCITPGYMRTDLTEPLVGKPEFGIEARIPAGRWGEAEDLQGACVLLASAAGDYIHGSEIVVDGGWLAW
jgi:2-deoxy-D-gluconate 3-dehydrogenase